MNAAIFWRVVWKEYRQQQGLWCAIAAAGVIMQLAVILYCTLNDVDGLANALFTVALSVPVLYSLGCGAALFAGEHEAETFSFQQSLPVEASRVFAGKLAFAAASALALFPILWLVAWVFSSWTLPDHIWHLQLWAGGSIATIEVLIWATLGSLVLRRVLPAAVVSGLIAVLLGYSSLVLVIAFGNHFQQQVDEYFSTLPLRSLCALFALAVAIKLGKHWFDEKPNHLFPTARKGVTKKIVRSSRVSTSWTVLRRLIWHEWRQSRVTMVWLVAGYFSLAIWFGLSSSGSRWDVMFVLLPVLATAAGACMFWSDQQGQRFHFFTEHGVRPHLVWLSRQLTWGFILATIAAIACAPLFVGWWPDEDEVLAGGLGLAVVMFASGQACSILIRSGIVAVFTAVFCSIVMLCWVVVLTEMGVWWVVCSLPLPFIFWWATWLYAPKWIQQRTSWRVRVTTAASIVVPFLGLVAVTAAYRVYEIPAILRSFDDDATALEPISAEAAKTAEMYLEANSLLQNKVEFDEHGVGVITERNDEWHRGIELLVAASERVDCHFHNWSDLSDGSFMEGTHLTNAAIAEARQLTRGGDLSGAATLYEALLKLAAHQYQQSSLLLYIQHAQNVEQLLWPELVVWASHPRQNREQVLEMVERIGDFSAENKPAWNKGALEHYSLVRRFVSLEDEVLSSFFGLGKTEKTLAKLTYRLMPWERARISRLLNIYTESELQKIERAATFPPSQLWPPPPASAWDITLTRRDRRRFIIREDDELSRWLGTTPWFLHAYFQVDYRGTTDRAEMPRRATQVQLALMAWQMRHGELPEGLEQLVGNGFRELPVDPYTGQPFVYVREGTEEEIWEEVPEEMLDPIDDAGMSMDGMGRMQSKLVPTDPFVWSPGTQLFYVPGTKRGPFASPVASDFAQTWQHLETPHYRAIPPRPGAQLTNDRELLTHGIRFFIPAPSDSQALLPDEPSGD